MIFILLVYFGGCKEDGSSVSFIENNESFQPDIAWTSLKSTPWPMYRADPQLTGRSRFVGPTKGIIVDTLIFPKGEVNSGITVNDDSTMYFGVTGDTLDLFAFGHDGIVKWAKKTNLIGYVNEAFNAPTIGNDDLLYLTKRSGVLALNENGNIVWRNQSASQPNGLVSQIGKDGTIYVISQQQTLYAISRQGQMLWSLSDSRFSWGPITTPSFSPDGKTLYIQCYNTATIAAVDIELRSIKWTFGSSGTPVAPVVDMQGNIYLLTYSAQVNQPERVDTFYCVTPEGTLKWSFVFRYKSKNHIPNFYNFDPTIDKFGNVYFATDTLYSLNHNGKVRWKFGLDADDFNYCPLVCDAMGTVYVGTSQKRIIAVSNHGKELWRVQISGILGLGYSPSIVNGRLIYPSWKHNSIYIIE